MVLDCNSISGSCAIYFDMEVFAGSKMSTALSIPGSPIVECWTILRCDGLNHANSLSLNCD